MLAFDEFITGGELRRIGLGLIGKADRLQKLLRALSRFRSLHARKLHRKTDVVEAVSLHQQVEALEDHRDIVPRRTKLRGGHRVEPLPVHDDLTGGGTLQHIDAAHERGFARAAHADDAVNVPVRNGQGDVLERVYPATCGLKGLA